MNVRPILTTLLMSACLVGSWCVTKPARAESTAGLDAEACDMAGDAAEGRYGIPPGLLKAIGRAESGRRDPATGRLAPWPWAINAEGKGALFDNRTDALASTRALQQSGVASIDVGCFQVNLVHHPAAFAVLEEGFDPVRNADYAARFLASLRSKTGSWEAAVAAYHSATPELGLPYRDRVLALWGHDGSAHDATTGAALPPVVPAVMRVMTWTAPKPGVVSGGMHVWTPSAAGQGASIIRITRG